MIAEVREMVDNLVPTRFPTSWKTISIGDVSYGGQYGLNAAAMTEGTGVRFIRITDIDDRGQLGRCPPAFVPSSSVGLKQYELSEGDILIARSGATAGKSYLHHSIGEDSVFAGYLIRFKVDTNRVLPSFLFRFLQTGDYWRQLGTHKRVVAQPNVNAKQLASIRFPLPPIPEQERIVSILDAAEELRRLREQADRRTADLIPALFHEMFGDPATNPKGWPRKPLDGVVDLQSGGTPSKEEPSFWNGTIPWITAKDMKVLEIVDSQDLVTEAALEQTALKTVPPGKILVVVRGMILAHTLPLGITRVPVTINQDLKAIFPDRRTLEPEFILWSLKSLDKVLLGKVSSAGHGTRKLDIPRLTETLVPLPPLSMQRDFASRVADIRAMEVQQAMSRRRLDDLIQSLLHRAFKGEL